MNGVTQLNLRPVDDIDLDEIAAIKNRLAALEVKEQSGATISDGSITSSKLADDSVTTVKILDANVTNAKLANMAQATVKGRASGAGTGTPADLSATQLNVIVGTANLFHPNRIWSGVSSDEGRGQTGTPPLTVKGNSLLVYRESADSQPPNLEFLKRRSGSGTSVNDGDMLGSIVWTGADTTTFGAIGAIIRGEVDGTPGSADMPARLVFLTTPDGSGAPQERVRITNGGQVGIGTNNPQSRLHVLGTAQTQLRVQSAGGIAAAIGIDDSAPTQTTFGTITNNSFSFIRNNIGRLDIFNTAFNFRNSSGDNTMVYSTDTIVLNLLATAGGSTANAGTRLNGAGNNSWLNAEGGDVGIGTRSPGSKLHVLGTNSNAGGITIESTAGTTALRGYIFPKDNVSLAFQRAQATGTFQWLDDSGAVQMVFDNSNNLGINVNPPSAKLHVNQGGTTAAQPVLTLVQADVSEQFIAFNTTIGTGNATEAVGSKTLTTTHFIKVSLTGVGFRYIPVGTIA